MDDQWNCTPERLAEDPMLDVDLHVENVDELIWVPSEAGFVRCRSVWRATASASWLEQDVDEYGLEASGDRSWTWTLVEVVGGVHGVVSGSRLIFEHMAGLERRPEFEPDPLTPPDDQDPRNDHRVREVVEAECRVWWAPSWTPRVLHAATWAELVRSIGIGADCCTCGHLPDRFDRSQGPLGPVEMRGPKHPGRVSPDKARRLAETAVGLFGYGGRTPYWIWGLRIDASAAPLLAESSPHDANEGNSKASLVFGPVFFTRTYEWPLHGGPGALRVLVRCRSSDDFDDEVQEVVIFEAGAVPGFVVRVAAKDLVMSETSEA